MTSDAIAISTEDVIRQVKLSCQVPAVVKAIVARKIISQTAEELDITVEESKLQEAADRFRLKNDLSSADATWSWLEKHRLSVDDFEELVYMELLGSKLARHLCERQVEPFFVERQLDYTQVVMYEVILDDRDLAMELFYALEENEIGFFDVARQYIQEPELRRTGGYRGILSRKDLKPEISAAVFAANPPQILRPIAIAQKAHLILVEEILRPQLDERLRSQILFDLFSQWLEQQIEQAEVILTGL
ncbi:MAG: peptidylprolyl isomerase [Hydrococcus sp. C42_A2020_068]|uniref:peptidylprolyl isomerase n=1 Tax=Pleurocapsa sp. PCC 7327 TaxID=118163 RepID=UPI00029F973E|nr:peptidylprolyl isomerase [Pleurocapsa sp. PCC 7327]AFY78107.1 parvulin-like peptidyl-prolyl isomerase [Pleurocapsa sp. PCC 7327]MBF2019716.1 peptidylprolyl isomerase [Hydrococcus sp. C42_A2020_068]